MNTPAVSIIMPAYNAAEFLSSAIDSVIAQTFTDWELIIADDASSDDTPNIIKHYELKDSRIRSLRMAKNSGRCLEPRIAAINKAKAQMILSIDADDIIDPQLLQKAMTRKLQTGADIILPVMYRFTSDTTDISHPVPAADFNLTAIIDGTTAMSMTIGLWQIAFIAALCNKSLYQESLAEIDLHDDTTHLIEVLSRILLDKAKTVAWTDAKYLYRYNDESVTHSSASLRNILCATRLVLNYICRKHPQSQLICKAMAAVFHSTIELMRKQRLDKKEKQEIAKAYHALDFNLLKTNVSSKMLFVMRLGRYPATKIFQAHAKIKG